MSPAKGYARTNGSGRRCTFGVEVEAHSRQVSDSRWSRAAAGGRRGPRSVAGWGARNLGASAASRACRRRAHRCRAAAADPAVAALSVVACPNAPRPEPQKKNAFAWWTPSRNGRSNERDANYLASPTSPEGRPRNDPPPGRPLPPTAPRGMQRSGRHAQARRACDRRERQRHRA